jgi:hypothetical protein
VTLNITCVGHAYVLQVADGRLSLDGRAVDGWWAKQLVMGCRDGVLAITWTGVGSIGDQPVDQWLAGKLSQGRAPEGTTAEAARMLRDVAQDLVAGLPADRQRHTFVVTGYRAAAAQWRPLVWYVSNCLDDHLQTVEQVTDLFALRPGPREPGELKVTGTEPAVTHQERRELKRWLRPHIPACRVQDRVAQAINQVALKTDYRELVSRNSISLLLERGKRPVSTFYPFDGDPCSYAPAMVFRAAGANAMVAGIQICGMRPLAGFGDDRDGGLSVDVARAPGFPYDPSRLPDPMAPPRSLTLPGGGAEDGAGHVTGRPAG